MLQLFGGARSDEDQIKFALELKNMDVNDVARETVQFITMQAIERKVELVSGITPDALPILGDRIQLKQVILNLVTNAIEREL